MFGRGLLRLRKPPSRGFVQLIISGALATGLLSLGLSTGNSGLANLSNTFWQPALQFGLVTLIIGSDCIHQM